MNKNKSTEKESSRVIISNRKKYLGIKKLKKKLKKNHSSIIQKSKTELNCTSEAEYRLRKIYIGNLGNVITEHEIVNFILYKYHVEHVKIKPTRCGRNSFAHVIVNIM